jgi:serine/threonine protein kinase/tetratricopeptide (TPR) repeat protein/TolB-like protein
VSYAPASRKMSEKWDQVKELFTSALERDAAERSAFLRQACGDDVSLRNEIESLLSSFDDAPNFLEDSLTPSLLSAQSYAMAGKRIGAYRILREIGCGGMAVVYLAERADEQYRKRVAIKMLHPGINKDEILRRFRNERQALATLDHPGIVKLLDGGSTEEGLPYLIMEYVEGVRIDEYCDTHKLSIPARLHLFNVVCLAVQYAHEKLVIHRDLKPSNILVTRDGVVRLLDFGIAKVLNSQLSPETTLTRAGWRAMTPEYASPEQVRGAPVTRTTDIYSLGVLLYELLTGHRPHRVGDDAAFEVEQSRYRAEAQKPSASVERIDEKISSDDSTRSLITPELVAEARALRPQELTRSLRGDLDTIVMKAIRWEPEERYTTAEEFAQDIERHLAGLPIKARKPTLLYRAGKFVRRHMESLATAILILTVTAGLAVGTARWLWKQKIATEPTPGAVHIRIRPSIAILGFKNLSTRPDTAWVSTALSEMLTTALAAGEQLRAVPEETVARTKLDLGLSDVESLHPEAMARVRNNLASEFIVVGSYIDQGKENGGQIRLDLRLEDTVKGETVAAISETGTEKTMIDLAAQVGARLRQQFGLEKLSQLEADGVRAEEPANPEAMRPYSQGLAGTRAFDALSAQAFLGNAVAIDPGFPLAHAELARTWSSLGYDGNAQQEAKKALDRAGNLSREKHLLVEARFYETSRDWAKAIEAYQTLFSFFPDNLEYGLQLANAETAAGRGKDALKSLTALDALGVQAKSDPRINIARSDAAASLGDSKLRRDTAELAAQQAGRQGAKLLLARARDSECRAVADLGENEKAKAACDEARQIYQAAGDRSGLAQSLHDMAEVPINQGDFGGAEKLYSQALVIDRAIGNQKGQAKELLNLGVISVKNGQFTTARRFYDEALQDYQNAGDKSGMAAVIGDTGILLRIQGKLQSALNHFQNALELSNEVGHRASSAQAMSAMGDVLLEEGDLPGAYQAYRQASAIDREIGRKIIYASNLTQIGQVFRQQGKAAEAEQAYRESLSMEEELGNKSDAAETRLALAELDCDSGRGTEAEQLSRAAVEAFRADAYADEQSLAQSTLSRALLQQGKVDDARSAITDAVRLSLKSQDVVVRIPVILDHACVIAAGGNRRGAEATAHDALTQARNLGLFRLQLEASLVLGEIQMQEKNHDVGRKRLVETEKTARSRGFELIAQKASAAQQDPRRR